MENTIKVSCSAVTHIGSDRVVNENRVYVNGKFLQSHLSENSQISLEADDSLFIFALSDGMEIESDSRISINEELKKFQRKTAGSSKDIQIKLDEMAESVQQTNNLLYSIALGKDEEESRNSAFSGVLIKDGSIAAINLGNSRIYKLESDFLKLVINDGRRTDRLLKMGIINDEQAELITGQSKSAGMDGSLKVRKSDVYRVKEGNEYLLCSASLIEVLGEETAFEILAGTMELDAAISQLIKEAMEKGCEDNIAAMVIRIEEALAGEEEETPARNTTVRRVHAQAAPVRYSRMARKRNIDIAGLASIFVIVAIIAAVLFGLFTFWMSVRNPNKVKDAMNQNTSSPTDGTSTADGIIPDETDDVEETESSTTVEPTDKEENPNAAGDNRTYIVKSGDSLMKISKEVYGQEGKYTLIMEANNITDANKIHVGQVLKIPPLQ